MSQTAPAPTAVMATDSAVAMSLTHSQIDTEQFQSALFPHLQCWETGDPPLEARRHALFRRRYGAPAQSKVVTYARFGSNATGTGWWRGPTMSAMPPKAGS